MSDEWPKNEAQMTASRYHELVQDDGKAYAHAWLQRQIDHMQSVFSDHDDFVAYQKELGELI